MSYALARPAGFSPAGERIYRAGLAFEEAERRRLAPPPAPKPANILRKEQEALAALTARIQAALDAPDDNGRLMLADIVAAVAADFGWHPRILLGESRKREHVIPRHVAMMLCHDLTGASSTQIGRAIGNRDHTTIIFGVRAARERMEKDAVLAAKVAALRARLEGAPATISEPRQG